MMKNLKINDVFEIAGRESLYVVTGVAMTGGGTGHGHYDVYPDRREITAAKILVDGIGRPIRFYEGTKKVTKVGRAKIAVTEITLS